MPSLIEQKNLDIEGRNVALLIVSRAADDEAIVAALDLKIKYKGVVLLLGGADDLSPEISKPLVALLEKGLVPVARSSSAILIDGGTKAGLMQLTGTVVARQDYSLPLIGVAPEELVSYDGGGRPDGVALDPNHGYFILVRGGSAWGDETATLFAVASLLGTGHDQKGLRSAIVVLAGGREISKNEILEAVRLFFPIIIVLDTGGLADELYSAFTQKKEPVTDPDISEILEKGLLYFHPLMGDPAILKGLLQAEFEQDKLLTDAWHQFADFDLNARNQQTTHKNFQQAILSLGVIAGGLSILWSQIYPSTTDHSKYDSCQWIFYYILILLPIILTVIIAAANKFKNGMKWIFFRAASEAIKREIYSYRTRTGAYRNAAGGLFSTRISEIKDKAMHTDINHTYIERYTDPKFPPYMEHDKGGDDGFSRLDPESYIAYRIDPQLEFYKNKTKKMNNRLIFFNWSTYIITGLGTLLAITEQKVWIALTSAIVAAIGSWLGYQQWDNTISKYNQGVSDLEAIKRWWDGLEVRGRLLAVNRDKLVADAERALQNEYDGWAQQMQQTLAEMSKQQQEQQRQANTHGAGPAKPKDQAGAQPPVVESATTKTKAKKAAATAKKSGR
jgi:hypothetical protein